MTIVEAKRELFRELKKNNAGVTGAGIKEKNGVEMIVIFITDSQTKDNIPTSFKGIKVITEITTVPKAI